MKFRKKVLLILVLIFVFSANILASSIRPDTTHQTIRIIGDRYYPPYEFLDENGVPKGFCIDLIKEVMKRLGKPYTIQLVSRDEIINLVKARKADIVLEMTYTPERAKILHFGTIYNYAFKGVLFRKEEKDIIFFEQLQGKTVAAEKGSHAETLLKNANQKIKIVPLHDLKEGFELLKSRKCDAMFCNYDIAKYISAHQKGLKASNVGLPPEKYCLTCSSEALLTKIDFIIYDLKKDGTYDKLNDKWFHENDADYYLHIIYSGLAIVLILFVLFTIFSTLLHYRVKKAKVQLERNQQNLDISLHAGDIGIWGYHVKKKLFYNVFCDYFPDKGRPYDVEITMFHPDDKKIFANAIQQACEGNPPNKPIIVRMDHTGKKNWMYVEKEIHSMRDVKGNVVRIIGTHKDVSERIIKDKKIRELLNDHEIIFNNTSIGTQYFDADGYLIRINDAACEIFGIENKKELLSKRPNLFEYPQLKDLIDKNHLKYEHFVICDDYDKYANTEHFYLRKKHGIHYIDTYITPIFGADNKLSCVIVNNSDMTEKEKLRKQVEEYAFRMKYILKASGVLTWTYNPDTQMSVSVDECQCRTEEVNWVQLAQNVSLDYRDQVIDLFAKMNKREMEVFSMQVKFDHTYVNDEATYYTIEGTPVRDKNGKITYYLGLSINITELINIQNNLQHEKEEAQKADKLKSAFLANVSHEIRTPLNSIIGFSDLLQYTTNEEDKRQFIDIIKTNNERLLKIIDDVLDLSKIESGTMKFIIEPVDLESIFNETYEVFSHQQASSKVKVLYEKPYNSCIIDTDRVRITQVLTNFMTNAVKYTREGHIRMGYECINGGIKIFVEDTGQGISRDRKDSVFERFEKLDSFVQGTGLGLSICKDISKIFKGKIGVESDKGEGSTFWMWVPGECKITRI